MIAAWAAVGANAPNGGCTESLAVAMPVGGDVIKRSSESARKPRMHSRFCRPAPTARMAASRCFSNGRLALAQETAQQPPPALARNEVDVADQFRSALPTLQHDLAA